MKNFEFTFLRNSRENMCHLSRMVFRTYDIDPPPRLLKIM